MKNIKDIKICFFSGDIAKSGGTERVSTIIANELYKRGYNICFLSYINGNESHYELNKNIKLFTLLEKNYSNFIVRKVMPYIKLIKFIKKEKINIMIDIDIILSLYTIPVKLFCKFKNISWEHFNFNDKRVKNRKRARKLASLYSDIIITLNKHDVQNYKRNLKDIKNINYIYNPSIVQKKEITKLENKIVTAVGRLNLQKGFDILLHVWKIIEEKRQDWKLQIIGDGEEKENLLEQIKELNLKNVEMLGFQNNIEDFYINSSIYVLTSRFEGFPMVLLEAQKKGLPIVSFDCDTGPSEIVVHNRNGYLIENGNIEECANKLLKLMNDKEVLKYFSKNAVEDSKRFDLKQIVDKWENILDTL